MKQSPWAPRPSLDKHSLLPVSVDLPLADSHVNGTIHSVAFHDWLIHVAWCCQGSYLSRHGSVRHSFLRLPRISLYGQTRSAVAGHRGEAFPEGPPRPRGPPARSLCHSAQLHPLPRIPVRRHLRPPVALTVPLSPERQPHEARLCAHSRPDPWAWCTAGAQPFSPPAGLLVPTRCPCLVLPRQVPPPRRRASPMTLTGTL